MHFTTQLKPIIGLSSSFQEFCEVRRCLHSTLFIPCFFNCS